MILKIIDQSSCLKVMIVSFIWCYILKVENNMFLAHCYLTGLCDATLHQTAYIVSHSGPIINCLLLC